MNNKLRLIKKIIFYILVAVLFLYSFFSFMYPNQTYDVIGFKTFSVLTNSMEPTIPQGSFVVIKKIKDPSKLEEGTVITFNADRLGEKIILTHRLAKKEMEEGKLRFFTQADGYYGLDSYKTYTEDLIGEYVIHIPYLGKIGLFLQSSYAIIMYLLLGAIYTIYSIVVAYLDRKKKYKISLSSKDFEITNIESEVLEDIIVVRGVVKNNTKYKCNYLRIELFGYSGDELVLHKECYLSDIKVNEVKDWVVWFEKTKYENIKMKISAR